MRTSVISLATLLLVICAAPAVAAPQLVLSLNQARFSFGDTIALRIKGDNGGQPIPAGDLYIVVQLPTGQAFTWNGSVFSLLFDGVNIVPSGLKPFPPTVIPTSTTASVLVVRELPPVDDGVYTFYAVLSKPGTSPLVSANQSTNVAAVATGIIGPLFGPTPFFQGNVELRDVILHAIVPQGSTVPIGCFVEITAINHSTERGLVSIFFTARDAANNFLGNSFVTGDLQGGQTDIIDGVVVSTPLPQGGADCSRINKLESATVGTFTVGFH